MTKAGPLEHKVREEYAVITEDGRVDKLSTVSYAH